MKKLKLVVAVCLLTVLLGSSLLSQGVGNTTVMIFNPHERTNPSIVQIANDAIWVFKDLPTNFLLAAAREVQVFNFATNQVATNLVLFVPSSAGKPSEKQSLGTKDLVVPLGNLLAAYAWPAVALILLLCFRGEIKVLGRRLSERLGSARNFKLTTSGLEIEDHVEALEAKTDSQAIIQQDILQLINAGKTSVLQSSDNKSAMLEVQKLANEYANAARIKDWKARVDRKNELVRLMGLNIVANRINKADLSRINHEGIRAGLAGAIHFEPAQDDLNLLLAVAQRAETKHCLYMVVTALSRLVDTGFVNKTEVPECERILTIAQAQADKPLEKRIRKTRALIQLTLATSSQEMSKS